MRLVIFATLASWTWAAEARAQDASCTEDNWTCDCEPNWGCWELFFTARDAFLAIKGTSSFVSHASEPDSLTASLLPAYSTLHYGTRRSLSAHVELDAAAGSGTHGLEGSVFASFGLGARASVTETRGFFARGGAALAVLGNDAFLVHKAEPLQLRLGYQVLDGPRLIEVGSTQGFVMSGGYALGNRRGSLSRAPELGVYAALRLDVLRIAFSMEHIAANIVRDDASSMQLARLHACVYLPAHVAACAELIGAHASALRESDDDTMLPLVRYLGVSVGLMP